ncbi:hypothetical protein ACWIYZ_04955 [Ursidibacter arcticus]
MVSKFIDFENLDESAFVGVQSGSDIKVKPKISNRSGNALTLTPQGLDVNAGGEVREYTCTWTNGARSGANDSRERRLLQVNNSNLGILHLDFIVPRRTVMNMVELPNGAPTPTRLIEVQTRDGGFVWIEANSRIVKTKECQTNTRYVIDLIGFFN